MPMEDLYMENQANKDKMKIMALVLNVTAIFPAIWFGILVYKVLSYSNGLALNYIPVRIIVCMAIVIVLFIIIPFFIKKNKPLNDLF